MVKKVWDDPKWQAKQAAKAAARKQPRTPAVPAPGPQGVPMHYAPGHGLRPAPFGHDGCNVPQLPQLGQAPPPSSLGSLVPLTPAYGHVPAVPQRRPGEVAGKAANWARKTAWRYRWQLTPVAAGSTLLVGAAVDAPAVTISAAAAAGLAGLAQKKGPDKLFGRRWLSRVERGLVAKYAAAAAAWSLGVMLGGWEPGSTIGLSTLALATGAQSIGWWRSRRVRGEHTTAEEVIELSEKAKALIDSWPLAVASFGPSTLLGSQLVDVEEPVTEDGEQTGTIVLTVQLRRQVHSKDVATDTNRRWLERELDQGVDTVRLELDRDHASRVRVVLTPTRHLETTSKIWPGPVVTEDGRVPVAVTPDGRTVYVRLWNATGVNHLVLVGSSGAGKTNTYLVLLLPGVLARKEVMFFIDGKEGASGPRLAPAMDLVARQPDEWRATVRMVYAIMQARRKRYGAMGLDEFDVNGPDPIINLVVDEGAALQRAMNSQEAEMFKEMSEQGRSLGISLKVCVQSPNVNTFPGGEATRKNLMGAVGNVVGLRPGDHAGQAVTLTATSENIDLLGLPAGPGWCAILNGGGVAAREARIMHIPSAKEHPEGIDLLAKHFPDDFTPRTLTGADAAAAGQTYANRVTGAAWREDMARQRAKHGYGDSADLPVSLDKPSQNAGYGDQFGLPIPPAATNPEGAPTSDAFVAAGDSSPDQSGQDGQDAVYLEFPELAPALYGASAGSAMSFELRCANVLAVIRANRAGLTHAGVVNETDLAKSVVSRVLDRLQTNGQIYKNEAGLWQATANEEAA